MIPCGLRQSRASGNYLSGAGDRYGGDSGGSVQYVVLPGIHQFWLVNHSLSGLALTAINLAVAAMIFFPFFKIYDEHSS